MISSDVIIILGHESFSNSLSEIAKMRIDRGLELYREKKIKMIMSGGFPGGFLYKDNEDPGFRQSTLMKKYAVEKGVPQEDILEEDGSRDTLGNACFTKEIVIANSWKNLIIVTSDFHLKKARFCFEYIYGEDYDLTYFGVVTDLGEEETKVKDREKKSIEKMKEIFKEKNIKKGDDKKIAKLLEDFYSKKI